MKRSLKRSVLVLTVCALFLSACATAGTPGTAPAAGSGTKEAGVIKIGAVHPMTGPAALYGEQVKRGIDTAVKQINEKGILGGQKIEVIVYDDQAKPEEGVAAYKKLMDRDKVAVVTGGVNSSVSLAAKEVTKDKILSITTVSKAPGITKDAGKWLFRLNSTTDMDGLLFHKFVAEKLKPKTVTVIAENTDYGMAELEALKKNWGNGGPQIVSIERFDLGATDFSVQLTSMKAKNADAFYVVTASPSTNGLIFKQAAEVGVPGLRLLAPGNLNSDMVKIAAAGGEGVISADLYMNSLDSPENKQFIAAYQALFPGKEPEKIELLGYESIWLVAQAIDKAGSATDYDKIASALRSTTWKTPRGEVKFNEVGQALAVVAPQVVKNGKILAYK